MKLSNQQYKNIRTAAKKFLIENDLFDFPLDMENVFEKIKNCRLVKYSTHCNKFYDGCYFEFKKHFNSKDGCADYQPRTDRYLVFYNDGVFEHCSPNRINWTLAHEIGHIMLEHHTFYKSAETYKNGLSDAQYSMFETEANIFACELLAPTPLLMEIYFYKSNITTDMAIKLFGLSEQAAVYTLIRLRKFITFLEQNSLQPQHCIDYYNLFCMRCRDFITMI